MTLGPEERQDFERGLGIIEARAASLNRFLQAYRQLAQMPQPVLKKSTLAPLVTRVAGLETRIEVKVIPGPEVTLLADPDQLEQMLINLVRNATEAVLEDSPSLKDSNGTESHSTHRDQTEVVVSWKVLDKAVALTIEDNGPGLMNPSNAFVPVLHHKTFGEWHRPGSFPADRGGARWIT